MGHDLLKIIHLSTCHAWTVILNTDRVGLVQWYRACLGGEKSGFDAQSRQPEITLGILVHKRQKSTGDDESTLTTHGQSHLKCKTEGTSGPTKCTSVQQKLKKKRSWTPLGLWLPGNSHLYVHSYTELINMQFQENCAEETNKKTFTVKPWKLVFRSRLG